MGRRSGKAERQQWLPKDGSGRNGSDSRASAYGGNRSGVVEFYGSEEECRMAREYLERMRAEEGIGGDFTMSSWQARSDSYGYGYSGIGSQGQRSRRARGDVPSHGASSHHASSSKQKEGNADEAPAKREKVRFDDADTAFILGRGGKTKHKIMRVSGAQLELYERNNVVDIFGSDEAVRKARKYIDLVRMQRVGPVHVDATHDDGDLTMLDVPSSCVGFVTGAQGNFLRTIEDEWGTLMFFCDYQGPAGTNGVGVERLAIFGTPPGRTGAKLKVMAAVDAKKPGHFTNGVIDAISPDEEWGTDTLPLGNEELSFALGKDGATRKKLARASGCILEYVGNVAYMVGNKAERSRARDYLTWLIQQRTGPVYVDISKRTDAVAVEVPSELTGILKGSTLRDIELETETFCFFEGDVDLSDKLLIFGPSKGRKQADKKVRELIRVRPRQPPPEDSNDRHRNEQVKTADVRISPVLAEAIESEKLTTIQNSCGARLTQQGTEFIRIEGYEQQVSLAKRQLNDYIFHLRVEEEFSPPKEVPFHVFIAKGPDGQISVLEEVFQATKVRVKVLPEEKKIVLAGLFSTVANAKRELQTFLSGFVTHVVHLDKKQIADVSAMGKKSFSKMKHFRHMCEAQINKDKLTLTLSGAPEAVAEGRGLVDGFFKEQSWPPPKIEVYSLKHCTKSNSKINRDGSTQPGSNKAAEIIQLTELDCAFILGRGGKTKHKIARVSGAQLELYEQNDTVEIIGTDEERQRARKYIELVRAQRAGPVHVDESHDDGDLTMIPVPHSCVGFVTGSQGNFLRTCEEEWGTLMFFCDYQGPNGDGSGIEKLAIFGGRTGRVGAELKVMAAIEAKIPGYFTRDVKDACSQEPWGRDSLPLGDEELSFALGKDGSTRKKLARASGCILEYVGNCAFMVGNMATRKRARDFLGWLLKQRTGTVYVDIEGRTDVTPVDIPDDLKGVASLFKSMTLRSIEQETRTFCFLEGNANKSDRLLIFSYDKACRDKAESVCLERIKQKLWNQDDDDYTPNHSHRNRGRHQYGKHEEWDDYGHYGEYDNYGYTKYDSYEKYDQRGKYQQYEKYDKYDSYGSYGNYDKHEKYNRRNKNYHAGTDDRKGDHSDVTDHFALKGEISVHVVIQTGPNGEDPVIEDVENSTGTQLRILRDKGLIAIQGPPDKVSQAKRQLQLFADKFITCKIQMRPEITAALANKVSHYIRPMPWIAVAEVDETKDIMKIQGHQDSVDRTFKVLREVYRDHGMELDDADVITKKKSTDDPNNTVTKRKGADIIRVGEDDAAFILGRGGKTKQKIARVSGATLELHERNNTVEIFGNDDERKKARKYVELVRAQRVGPVNVDESHDDGDLTMIVVPHSCVGFVTGTQGNFLRSCEEEWGTLMFFCDYQGPNSDDYEASERLAIFGDLRGRCGAELKVMAAIETKIPRYFTKNLGDTHCTDEWGFDTTPLQADQLSYALGKRGSTRRKLARASGCIIEYVGNVVFLSGTLVARKRAREYLGWLCDQVSCKTGKISIDPATRDDVTLVPVPKDCIGYVMGDKRHTLSRLEEDWHTLIFFVDNESLPSYQDVEGLAIFGDERGRAGTELKVMGAVETKLPQFFTKGVGDFHCPAQWGVDTLPLANEELSFALGKEGNTRKKLARSSGCTLEYVGNVAYMAGDISERSRAREYLQWLLKQRHGAVSVDIAGRNDVTVVTVPDDMKGLTKSSTLRDVEKQTGTFCFFQGDTSTSNELLVCGHRDEDRIHAEHILRDILVRGASRPKPKRRAQNPTQGRGGGYPAARKVQAQAPKIVSSEESDTGGSDAGSGSDRYSRSGDDAPAAMHPRGYNSRRRQWASEDSNSASDEEIVPYW